MQKHLKPSYSYDAAKFCGTFGTFVAMNPTLELTHAQTQASTAQQQQQAQQERHAEEIQRLNERHANETQRLNERLTQAQTEREQALQAASATREDAAGLRGELEALRVQNAALLATLSPPAPAKDSKTKSKPA